MITFILLLLASSLVLSFILASSLVLSFIILPILAIGIFSLLVAASAFSFTGGLLLALTNLGICSLIVATSAFSFTGGLLLALINPRLLDNTPLLTFVAASALIGTSAYIPIATAGLGLSAGITLALCLVPEAAMALSVGFLSLIFNKISLPSRSQPSCPHSSKFFCCPNRTTRTAFPVCRSADCSFFFGGSKDYNDGINGYAYDCCP